MHPHALTAALAAESVAATAGEDVFWQFHEKLFVHQARLTDPDLQLYAGSLGADPELAAGAGAQQFAPIVQADYASGIEVGVSAYDGRVDLPSLQHATGLAADAATKVRRRPWQRR